jgi:hypothetical protein
VTSYIETNNGEYVVEVEHFKNHTLVAAAHTPYWCKEEGLM